jgi:hypothetical protein
MKRHSITAKIIISILSVIAFVLSQASSANEAKSRALVDLYRSKQVSADEIYKNSKPEFEGITNILLSKESVYTKVNEDKVRGWANKIKAEIAKAGKFAFINISPVIYPGKEVIYFTIDLVDEADKQRLENFSKKPDQTFADPYHLIKLWQQYENIGMEMLMKDKVAAKYQKCPAFHCVFGFDHPKLKKYQSIFNAKVPRAEKQLVQILRNDKDEQKRGAAAFLLAHLKDGKKIIQILIPSIHDADRGVRNNAMRVMAETLMKLKDPDFPIQEAVSALDFPIAGDRNKALYILVPLSMQPRYAEYLRKHAGTELLAELKLHQNNVHDLSYYVLKQISGKNYADRDYPSWESWLKEQH